MDVHYRDEIIHIPKEFILNALCTAPENALKTMLILLSNLELDIPDIENIAKQTGMSAKDLNDGIEYWITHGYMSKNPVNMQLEIAFSPVSRFALKKAYNPTLSREKSLVGQIEKIHGSPLSTGEIEIFLYIFKDLDFSEDLILYLADYCQNKGKFFSNYIKAVAMSWHERGVQTVDDAKANSTKYPAEVYQYINQLGKRDNIAPAETETVYKWIKDYRFSDDVIRIAINKALESGKQGKIAYADKLLTEWHNLSLKTPEEILRDSGKKKPDTVHHKNERAYDFNQIEKELLGKHIKE